MRNKRTGNLPPPVPGAAWVELSNGQCALIDDRLSGSVGCWLWTASVNKYGTYAIRVERGKVVYLHRWIVGAGPGDIVDHMNGDRLDCRVANLRLCTNSQNQQNRRKRGTPRSTSRFKGVYWDGARWVARVHLNGQSIHVGRFTSEEAAARAYDSKAAAVFGEFAHINFQSEAA